MGRPKGSANKPKTEAKQSKKISNPKKSSKVRAKTSTDNSDKTYSLRSRKESKVEVVNTKKDTLLN